ncbi:MAG: Uma2 family endonuclease [Kofleriaceae bacterium]
MPTPSDLADSIRPLRRAEFYHLTSHSSFEDERVELLRGVIVLMSPEEEPRHSAPVEWLLRRLIRGLDEEFRVRPGMPFDASEYSVTLPDLVVSAEAGLQHPSTALLLIEVSNTSLRKDRGIKLAIYAEAGVPEYWIINASRPGSLEVEVYTEPTPTGYARLVTMRDSDVLRPVRVPIAIQVADIPRPTSDSDP